MAESFADIGRVAAIARLFEGTGYKPFGEPLWHSAAEGDCVATVAKTFLEGIDFNLEYFPLKHLGYKSVVAATGELYAVMASPKTLTVQLGISAKLDLEQIKDLWQGMIAAAKEHGYGAVSLDLQPSKNGLCISVCVSGSHSSDIGRPEARSKDLICVSGRLGAAFLGCQVLEKKPDELEKYKMMVGEYLRPELEADTVSRLVAAGIFPSFGYFVNRGLSDAVLRLVRDSGLGVKIYADRIPFEGNSFSLGRELDIDPISAAMNGGEDCKLLFTIPIMQAEAFRRDFQTFSIIGHLAQPEVGAVLVSPDGLEHPVRAQGWQEE